MANIIRTEESNDSSTNEIILFEGTGKSVLLLIVSVDVQFSSIESDRGSSCAY